MTPSAQLSSLAQDARVALRQFRRNPGFAVVLIAIFALGIGASTAVFTLVNASLLAPLPYPHADRIVQLWEINDKGGQMRFSDPNFEDVRARSRSFASLAEEGDYGIVSVSGAGEPTRAHMAVASRDFFDVFGVLPLRGRLFTPDEQVPGGAPAAVVSYRFWQEHFGASPSALGSLLRVEDRTYTVVGVMPASLDALPDADFWIPRELEPRYPSRTAHNWKVIGRLRDRVSIDQARREVSGVAHSLSAEYGRATITADMTVRSLRDEVVGRARPMLLLLFGASLVLLVIGCTNAVNLLVARMAARQGEIALRAALGAGRGRLVRQFIVEAFVLALAGGAAGLVLARLGLSTMLALRPGQFPRSAEAHIDLPVVAFAIGVTLLVAVGIGVLTAWRGTRANLRDALSDSQRSMSAGGASYRLRGSLVVAQIAMTLALLVSAGLLARSFQRLLHVDPGFRYDHAVVLDLAAPGGGDSVSLRQRVSLYDDLLAGVRRIPGVVAAGGIDVLPIGNTDNGCSDGVFIEMHDPNEHIDASNYEKLTQDRSRTADADFCVASEGYFQAMHIPLLSGRLFDDRDAPDAPPVALISARLARLKWPNESPIGKLIFFGNMDLDMRPLTVVGVVGDVRDASLAVAPTPMLYVDYRQRPRRASTFNIVIEHTGDAMPVIVAARRLAHDRAPDVPPRLRTLDDIVYASVADRRFALFLVGVFGAAALLLATVGVYAVISYVVTQRRRELGIRLALGGTGGDILRLVLGQAGRLAAAGIVIGTVLSLAASRALGGLLYGVSATDPLSFAGVILCLGATALLASYLPARRAARTPPSDVLRG